MKNKKIKIKAIYKIRNIINNKVYVGSTNNYNRRTTKHIFELKSQTHHSNHLQNAWNKYGKNNFVFEIIEVIENDNALMKREQYWIDKLKSYDEEFGYNIRPTAGNSGLSWLSSSERSKLQIGKHIGSKNSMAKLNEQTVKKIKYDLYHGKSTKYIMNKFNITKAMVHSIRSGGSWSHVKIRGKIKSGPLQGEDNINTVITERIAKKIIGDLRRGDKICHIQKKHNVSRSIVECINRGRCWRYLYNGKFPIKNITPKRGKRTNKLSKKDVRKVKRRVLNKESMLAISKDYPVSYSCIYDIAHGFNYRNLN